MTAFYYVEGKNQHPRSHIYQYRLQRPRTRNVDGMSANFRVEHDRSSGEPRDFDSLHS
jgi:hypothetical protein